MYFRVENHGFVEGPRWWTFAYLKFARISFPRDVKSPEQRALFWRSKSKDPGFCLGRHHSTPRLDHDSGNPSCEYIQLD